MSRVWKFLTLEFVAERKLDQRFFDGSVEMDKELRIALDATPIEQNRKDGSYCKLRANRASFCKYTVVRERFASYNGIDVYSKVYESFEDRYAARFN